LICLLAAEAVGARQSDSERAVNDWSHDPSLPRQRHLLLRRRRRLLDQRVGCVVSRLFAGCGWWAESWTRTVAADAGGDGVADYGAVVAVATHEFGTHAFIPSTTIAVDLPSALMKSANSPAANLRITNASFFALNACASHGFVNRTAFRISSKRACLVLLRLDPTLRFFDLALHFDRAAHRETAARHERQNNEEEEQAEEDAAADLKRAGATLFVAHFSRILSVILSKPRAIA
jgi:hypothetical protein